MHDMVYSGVDMHEFNNVEDVCEEAQEIILPKQIQIISQLQTCKNQL